MQPWMCYCAYLAIFWGLLALSPVVGYFGLTSKQSLFSSLVIDADGHVLPGYDVMRLSNDKLCVLLTTDRHQRRHCERETGAGAVLLDSVRLASWECARQFEGDRWNCSMGQPYRHHLLRKAFKETAFLHAVTSSALLHAVARGCGSGQMARCPCARLENYVTVSDKWRWTGCGDNVEYSSRFARKLLQTKTWPRDMHGRVDLHNVAAGLKIVKKTVETPCKCHGVSGSCTVKTCWRQMAPFSTTGSVLRNKYNSAREVVMATNAATKDSRLLTRDLQDPRDLIRKPRSREFVYMERSPSYCLKGTYSPGTRGRKCKPGHNCDVICCGRGYNTQHIYVDKPCNCKVIWCCEVKCQKCTVLQEIFTCK